MQNYRISLNDLPPEGKEFLLDDPAIWQGDAVALMLETDQHSYYEIAVNPAGAVCDAGQTHQIF